MELDEPVTRLLRRMDGPLDDTVAAAREITVRDLLTFTFGFGMHIGMFMAETPWPIVTAAMEAELGTIGPPDPDIAPAADEWIKRLGSLPLMAQPGERWFYNTGAQVLSVLCQRAAGATSYAEAMRTHLLEPLGMTQTSFFTTDASRLATAPHRHRADPAAVGVSTAAARAHRDPDCGVRGFAMIDLRGPTHEQAREDRHG